MKAVEFSTGDKCEQLSSLWFVKQEVTKHNKLHPIVSSE